MQEVCGVVVETSIRAFDAKLWRIGAIGYNGTVNTVSKKVEALLDLKMSSMITMGIKRSNRWYLVPYLLFCVLRCTSTQQVRYILCYRYRRFVKDQNRSVHNDQHSTARSNMATIKMTGKKEKQQLYMKIAAVVVLVLVAVGIFTLTGGDNDAAPKTPQVRSQEVQLTHQEADTTEEGRLFTFELGNLKDGTTGTVTIRTRPSWAPIGVDQFHKLADSGFFDGCRFFRVVPNFIVQFGINVSYYFKSCVYPSSTFISTTKIIRATPRFKSSGEAKLSKMIPLSRATNGGH